MRESSKIMSHIILKNFGNDTHYYSEHSTATTKLYMSYNLLMYPLPEYHELFKEIFTFFKEVQDEGDDKKYYIQCWLNVYNKGEFIGWHTHWPPEAKAWHGFYCVYTEPNSGTHYRLPPDDKQIFVPSEDNLIVISKSDGDLHMSTEWTDETHPRVTIAFDIIPRENIVCGLNHWVPIL
jgi:hypothetical protein